MEDTQVTISSETVYPKSRDEILNLVYRCIQLPGVVSVTVANRAGRVSVAIERAVEGDEAVVPYDGASGLDLEHLYNKSQQSTVEFRMDCTGLLRDALEIVTSREKLRPLGIVCSDLTRGSIAMEWDPAYKEAIWGIPAFEESWVQDGKAILLAGPTQFLADCTHSVIFDVY